MRLLAAVFATLIAAPAIAQPYPPPYAAPANPQQEFDWRTQHEMLRQQMVQQQNQLMALEAQMRANQALADIQAQKSLSQSYPRAAQPPPRAGAVLPRIDTSKLASIPDSALADSNRKVLDAAANRR
ncbi:hypothetical protein [Phenylobacterium soli]|uniref:Uncharacterized protein n=1 Tax=Phenylobacterium soli TaxID=2170551 RepID=A0A328ABD8_9CAUL|nr:hypothetical protein [Phenylobacterium soli]RAK51899.1 hypothetical protein DJ017_18980 [Phenylobacterium soli]